MSAFFVQPAVIDDVAYLVAEQDFHKDQAYMDALGRDLHALNATAVIARYGLAGSQEAKDYKATAAAYKYHAPSATNVQMLKSLACFNYQCSEDPVCNTTLFAALCKIEQLLTLKFANGRTKVRFGEERPYIEGYDDAKWDRSR